MDLKLERKILYQNVEQNQNIKITNNGNAIPVTGRGGP
jgi:hypothetical protein